MNQADPTPNNADSGAEQRDKISAFAKALEASYGSDDRTAHIDSAFLPSRSETIRVLELVRKIVFPGFFDKERIARDALPRHIQTLLTELDPLLYEQVRQSIRYGRNMIAEGEGDDCDECDEEARAITDQFLGHLPELRRMLGLDVQAAFDGDPAAKNTDEAVFCYPGIDAIFTHRVANFFERLDVPLLPRIMSEYAHNETGVDIHPGATIGESFFIDHATGVVIGETCTIGKRVKIYQGVTLGALSTKGGQAKRNTQRHPTLEDDVTIYAGATILGGDTVIGERSTIAGSVFVTQSVPPDHVVLSTQPEPKLRARNPVQSDWSI